MLLHPDFDLRPYNTFQLEARSAFGALVTDEHELREAFATATKRGLPVRVLGGGSNVVLSPEYEGITALMTMKGRGVVDRTADHVIVEAAAGEDWAQFVNWTLEAGLSGLENLSSIPGTVGAAPVQNIGAYGLELGGRFASLRAYDRKDCTFRSFSRSECGFGYRHSTFKDHPDRFVIVSVRLALPAQWRSILSYSGLKELADRPDLTPFLVSRTVTQLRAHKLPDWRRSGNAGSFFRNPVLSADQARSFRARHPEAPASNQPDGGIRLSAAWLIEHAGFKGYRDSGAGVSGRHALVIVNYGEATQSSILALAGKIKAGVGAQFGVSLVEEPVYT